MDKKIETTISKHIVVSDEIKLGDKYFYPFSGKDFILTNEAFKEALSLQKEQRLIILNIVEKIDNIFKFKYNPDVENFKGKVPDSFNKHGVFILKVRGLILDCFIDIFGLSDKCVIFGVRCAKQN